jgi:hypothetical protein
LFFVAVPNVFGGIAKISEWPISFGGEVGITFNHFERSLRKHERFGGAPVDNTTCRYFSEIRI